MDLVTIMFNKITQSQKFKYDIKFFITRKIKAKQNQLYPKLEMKLLGTGKILGGSDQAKVG